MGRRGPALDGPASFHAERAAYHRGAADAHAAAMRSNPEGAPQRGIRRKGKLGGPGYTKRPASERRAILTESLETYGYASTMASVTVLLANRHIKPRTRRVIESDVKWLKKHGKALALRANPAGVWRTAGKAAAKHGRRAADEAKKALVPILKHAAAVYGKQAVTSACAAAHRALDDLDDYEPTRRKTRSNPSRLVKPVPRR